MPSGTRWDSPPRSHGFLFPCRLPKRQFGKSGLADDLEALEATGSFLEENRKATMTSFTQQEALENYEKSGYDAEENEQEKPTKPKETGKERNLGTAFGKNATTPCFLGCIYFLKSLA